MWWSIAIGLVIVALIVIVIARRAMQVTKLAHDGVATEGKVIKKFRSHGSGVSNSAPYLRYESRGPAGRRHEYKICTTEEFWEAHEIGDTIEIVYAKSNPSISGAKYMVNQSREALKLPPL